MVRRFGGLVVVALIGAIPIAVSCSSDPSATPDAVVADASPSDVSLADASDASSTPDAVVIAPEPTDGAKSGTRLQVVHWQATDGFRFWSGRFFDKVLGQECVPARWTDGKIRCTPPSWRLQTGGRGAFDTKVPFDAQDADAPFVAYGQQDCTDPVAVVPSGATVTAQTLALELEPEACATNTSGEPIGVYQFEPASDVAHVYHVGAARNDSDVGLKEALRADCASSYNLLNVGAGHPYEIATEVPASAFVELTPSFTASAGAFTTSVLTSADGAIYPRSARSTTFGGDCYFRYLYGSSLATCVPEELATGLMGGPFGALFEDLLCQTQVGVTPKACEPPVGVSSARIGGAAIDYYASSFFLAGPQVVGASVSDGTCHPYAGPDTLSFWHVGAQTALPTLARVHDTLAGRRSQLVHLTSGGYTGRDLATMYDAKLGVECALTRDASGVVYCVPVACGQVEQLYSDAGCTTKAFGYVHAASGDPTFEPECATLPVPTHAGRHKVTGPLPADRYFLKNTGPGQYQCTLASTANAYALGPELPLTDFVSFTKVNEP